MKRSELLKYRATLERQAQRQRFRQRQLTSPKRSQLLKWLSKVVEKVEHLDTARQLDTKAKERISELEQKLQKLENRHEALLRRYNELEARWPTLMKLQEVHYPPISRPQRYS